MPGALGNGGVEGRRAGDVAQKILGRPGPGALVLAQLGHRQVRGGSQGEGGRTGGEHEGAVVRCQRLPGSLQTLLKGSGSSPAFGQQVLGKVPGPSNLALLLLGGIGVERLGSLYRIEIR